MNRGETNINRHTEPCLRGKQNTQTKEHVGGGGRVTHRGGGKMHKGEGEMHKGGGVEKSRKLITKGCDVT